MVQQGKTDVWVIQREGKFAGFGATINGPDMVLLDYFAVEKSLRGKGVGSAALRDLVERYQGMALFVEIEGTWEDGPDKDTRQKRKQFYLSCGMEPIPVRAEVFGVKMELLGCRCSLDFEQYRAFYREQYSTWAAEHILPVQEQ